MKDGLILPPRPDPIYEGDVFPLNLPFFSSGQGSFRFRVVPF